MIRTRRTILTATTTLALLAALAGCSLIPSQNGQSPSSSEQSEAPVDQSSALKDYADAERAQLPSVMEANPGVFSDIQVEAQEPSTVAFTYTYASVMDVAGTASSLDGLIPTIQDGCDKSVFPAMVNAGIEDPQVTYTYLNSDGTEIWTHSFTQS